MTYGYHGKILHVNLTEQNVSVEEPPKSFYRFYMGGSAMGLYYLLKNTPPQVDPLSPENTLCLMLSVLTGAPISGQSRMTAVAKSPLTSGVGDSQSGGFWPAELKFAGFDGLVIRGKAEKPVYLWIHDGEVEIRDASHLWGKITGEVDDILHDELDDNKIEILQCGPAGENRVRFAAIMSMSNRANGRTGMGAVMGSKNLKAIAVRGKQRPSVADSKSLNQLARWGAKNLEGSDVEGLAKYGTAEVMMPQHLAGGLPTRNWDSGVFDGAEAISGETMADNILTKRDTCYACTIRCKRVVEVTEGPYIVNEKYGGPEYETLATFGSYCGVDNLEAIAYANQLCNQYGMDTISCGATIAWAINCFEEGLLTLEDTGGIELKYGDADLVVQLTEMIGKREGIGDLLADGSAHAASVIGKGTEDLVVTVKKQEMPAHMPQHKKSLGVIYAVNPFGADHQSSEHDPAVEKHFKYYEDRLEMLGISNKLPERSLGKEKIEFALKTQYLFSALDTINLCQFVFGPAWQLYGPDQMVEAVQLITGWDVDLEELMTIGQRRLNLLRAFNAREGIGRESDTLPKKLRKALKGGRSDGWQFTQDELDQSLDMYYELSGWDLDSGYPTKETLQKLELEWVIDLIPQH